MSDFSGQQIVVVGAGATGIALVRYLAARGAEVTLSDRTPSQQLALPADLPARLDLGGHTQALFTAADRIVVSPGVPLDIPVLQNACAAGVPVGGELDLALAELDVPVIAVTGTNGKSTTTSLIGAILAAWGKRVFVGGNLGTPLIEAVGQPWDYLVVEVSSFQLEATETLKPRYGLLLHLTPDHLDRYPDMAAYVAAKIRLFNRMDAGDTAVLNADDPRVLHAAGGKVSRSVLFSSRRLLAEGLSIAADELLWRHRGSEHRFALAQLRLKGQHNRENVMAALAPPLLEGCPPAVAWDAACGFAGLPHRMQSVRTLAGVEYIDDSKGTNVGSVLMSLAGVPRPVTLIAGGLAKGQSFAELRPLVEERVSDLILIGRDADLIAGELGDLTRVHRAESMAAAVAVARQVTPAGGTVLLSPGCASFDMFRSYGHRGELFAEAVHALPEVEA